MFYLLVTPFTNDISLIWYTTYKSHFTYKWRYLSDILLTNIWSISYTLLTNTSSINYTLPTNDPLLARYTLLTNVPLLTRYTLLQRQITYTWAEWCTRWWRVWWALWVSAANRTPPPAPCCKVSRSQNYGYKTIK